MIHDEKRCEVCGQRVRVVSSSEGTCSYEGMERRKTLLEAAEVADKFKIAWEEKWAEAVNSTSGLIANELRKMANGGINE